MTLDHKLFDRVGGDNQALSREDPGTMYPTHKCFEDAACHAMHIADGTPLPLQVVVGRPDLGEMLQALLAPGGRPEDWELAHGIIAVRGMDLVHAWVECRREKAAAMVFETYWFRGERVLAAHSRKEWYGTFVPRRTCRYSVAWVREHAESGGDCGPWVEHLNDLIDANIKRLGRRLVMRSGGISSADLSTET